MSFSKHGKLTTTTKAGQLCTLLLVPWKSVPVVVICRVGRDSWVLLHTVVLLTTHAGWGREALSRNSTDKHTRPC